MAISLLFIRKSPSTQFPKSSLSASLVSQTVRLFPTKEWMAD